MVDAIKQSLGFNTTIFLLQIVVFVVLLVVMNLVFWKPFQAHMTGRDRSIADKYHTRDSLQKEMEALRADYLARINVVEGEARAHIQTAIKEAQSERERLIAEARDRFERAIKQGAEDMEREKAEALQDMRERMVGIATSVADAALASTTDRTALRSAVETRISHSLSNGKGVASV